MIPKLAARNEVDLVVSIPPHAGKADRFECYREQLCDGLDAEDDVDVRIANPVPPSYKHLSRDEKRALRAGRYTCHDDLSRQTVLVIDDVTTTGSTIGAMSDALYEAGAARVIQLGVGGHTKLNPGTGTNPSGPLPRCERRNRLVRLPAACVPTG